MPESLPLPPLPPPPLSPLPPLPSPSPSPLPPLPDGIAPESFAADTLPADDFSDSEFYAEDVAAAETANAGESSEYDDANGNDATDADVTANADAPPAEEVEPSNLAVPSENITQFGRFWRKFGGSSFILSIGIHAMLVIFLLLWVVAPAFTPQARPDAFDTGQGGGKGGDAVSMKEHRVKPRNAKEMARSSVKILSKSTTATMTLPDTPSFSMNALSSGALASAVSKGSGGGDGGGAGPGLGVGRGGGKNFVSLFGASGFGSVGLEGTLYDIKRTSKGKDTAAKTNAGINFYLGVCRQFVNSGWDVKVLRPYWHSPNKLWLQQVFMPFSSADAAPEAFDAKGMAGKRWIAHYKGRVTAPFTGKMRFVGMADDWITVRWDGKNVLVSGYTHSHSGHYGPPPPKVGKNSKPPPPPPLPDGIGDTYPCLRGPPFQSGAWLNVEKGKVYPIEIAIGETPGGVFYAFLAFQLDSKDNKDRPLPLKDSPLLLFRMSDDEIPESVTNGSRGAIPRNIDLSGGNFIWKPTMKSGPTSSGGSSGRL